MFNRTSQATISQSRIFSTANVELRPLPAAVIRTHHHIHGDLTITRKAKTRNELRFEFELQEKNGKSIYGSHTMYVTRSARNYRGQSAVGYNYIDLGDLQGKGIGYLYHAVAAAAARELGVDLFVVDDVVEDAMRNLCEGAGMNPSWDDSYSLSPSSAERAFRNNAISKGWATFP